MITPANLFVLALAAWRENRGGGSEGMHSVINVMVNRAKIRGTSVYTECTRKAQVSSLTALCNPGTVIWPVESDPDMGTAFQLASAALSGHLEDITNGATVYYAPGGMHSAFTFTKPDGAVVPFPEHWQKSRLELTAEIQRQLFFREV